MKSLLVISKRGVTIRLPVEISYKHYSQEDVDQVVREIGLALGDRYAYLEAIEDQP